MTHPATYMRAKMLRELSDLGITNIDESENYHMKFTYEGHLIDFCTSNSWFSFDNEKYQGNMLLLDMLRKI